MRANKYSKGMFVTGGTHPVMTKGRGPSTLCQPIPQEQTSPFADVRERFELARRRLEEVIAKVNSAKRLRREG